MSQTREDRIWRHYKSLRRTSAEQGFDPNWKWLQLARTWQMPVRAVKDIIAARKGPTMEPVYCCEDYCFIESWREVTPAEQHANALAAHLKAEIERLSVLAPEHACDTCSAPVMDAGAEYHRDGCPDFAEPYDTDEEVFDRRVRALTAVRDQWVAVIRFRASEKASTGGSA